MKQIKKWQEPIYAIGGFGPGFLYQVTLTYLLYYYRPAQKQIAGGAVVFAPVVGFAVVTLIARILDGVVDIPIAGWTDNMRSKWGRRRPLMLLGWLPMAITFILLWYPPLTGTRIGPEGHWLNALYIAVVSSAFFFFYTLMIVPYLAALSEIVPDEQSRVRVASWQTFFNTAGYVLTFVVAPMLFEKFGLLSTMWVLLPVAISFIGPLLVIKEMPTDGSVVPMGDALQQQPTASDDVPLWDSVKLTLGNRTFRIYMLSVATFFFGLQLFLGGIAFMAADMMGLSESQLGMMNGAVFAPVPVMLVVFNLITRKKGAKWAFRLALLVFAAVMFAYPLAWTQLNFPVTPMMVGIILGVVASFSTGVFFTIPYAFPAEIAASDAKKTGKDRAGMFFAVQGLINQFMGSLSASFLALLLTWQYGVVIVAPIAGVTMIAAFFFFAPYPLGQKTAIQD
jgi:glycoside/pentoside/hexuronide:cation symporter, GPH family